MHVQDGAALLAAELLDHLAQAALRNDDFPGQIQHVVKLVDIGAQRAVTGTRKPVHLYSRTGSFSHLTGANHSFRPLFHLPRYLFSEVVLCRGKLLGSSRRA